MHPYEMQRLIRERHKDEFLDLKPGSLYHAIKRLQAAGQIEAVETTREGRRPERTVYRITEAGDRESFRWLRALLASPAADGTPFFAALSFIGHLTPADAAEQLTLRAGLLAGRVAELDASIRTVGPRIGRLFLLEAEYARAVGQAELAWVRGLIDDLNAGRLTWEPPRRET
jgi:DNA-binding PadR family transcriptional regulator